MSCSFSPAKRAPQNARRAVAAAVLDRKTRRLLCRRQCHRPCRHWSHWRPDDFRSFAYVVVSMFRPFGQSSFFRFFLWWVVSSVYRSVFAVLVIFFTVHESADVASLLQYPLPMASSTVCACRPSTTTNEVRTGDAMRRVRIVQCSFVPMVGREEQTAAADANMASYERCTGAPLCRFEQKRMLPLSYSSYGLFLRR